MPFKRTNMIGEGARAPHNPLHPCGSHFVGVRCKKSVGRDQSDSLGMFQSGRIGSDRIALPPGFLHRSDWQWSFPIFPHWYFFITYSTSMFRLANISPIMADIQSDRIRLSRRMTAFMYIFRRFILSFVAKKFILIKIHASCLHLF